MGKSSPSEDKPLVMVAKVGNQRVIHSANAAAANAGLKPGMPSALATAMIADLHCHNADPERDEAELYSLAEWAMRRYSPLVSVDAPDGLRMDVTGAAHLFGGEAAMLKHMIQTMAHNGITARAAMAPCYGAAHGLARFGTGDATVAGDDVRERVAELPMQALRLPRDLCDELVMLGFDHIGDLLGKPRTPLTLRFGRLLGNRLDQSIGCAAEPLKPLGWHEVTKVHRLLAEPIGTAETFGQVIAVLVPELCRKLEVEENGVRQVDLLFHRVDNRIELVRIGLARQMRDAKRLSRLLLDKLETVDPGPGVEMMTLIASWTERLMPTQVQAVFGRRRNDIAELVDLLANRLGHDKVYRFGFEDSDVPERSIRLLDPLAPIEGMKWPKHWSRPARLLPRPMPILAAAALPDYPPRFFMFKGKRHIIAHADGPERIFGEWWKRDTEIEAVRDYFQVEDEAGGRFWIFRKGDGVQPSTGSHEWFLHGLFQ